MSPIVILDYTVILLIKLVLILLLKILLYIEYYYLIMVKMKSSLDSDTTISSTPFNIEGVSSYMIIQIKYYY